MSSDPFSKLVKLAARAFYDDISTKGDNQPKTGRSDNRGIAVVVLDALTRRQWVREEDLAKELKLHSKQLRRTLRYFEEEKLIARDHRKETAKGAKLYSNAVAATADGQSNAKEGEEKIKLHTHSYCCLDYAQIFDIVRYRVHRMKKKLKEELDDKNTIQKYVCPNCGKRYDALDAMRLVSMEDENFHCERCNGELVAESDKLVAESDKLVAQGGDGDDNARRRRREKLNDMLQKIEVQLKPLFEQLNRVKDLHVPEFLSLQAWEAQANAAARANGDPNSSDPSRGHQFSTPMPFPGEAKVEVAFSGGGNDENSKSGNESSSLKVLPPWMIRQSMNLTKEQRGEALHESKMSGSSLQSNFSDDKKQIGGNDDKKSLQDEYLKAYYAALLKKQEEMRAAEKGNEESNERFASSSLSESFDRQVGMKTKREEYEKDEDVEWEEAPVADNGIESYKVNDLNVEAEPSAEDDEDDVDWEEG